MKKKILSIAIFLIVIGSVGAYAKTYDLVLLHGLTNKHQWSNDFVNRCLEKFGSGNVYIIYTNDSTRVWERWINGRKAIVCGENDYSAGDDSVNTQAGIMDIKIAKLKASYGLSSKFNIIAHSMGGLVARRYSYYRPNTVAGIVTLGTPHHGSPLAYEGQFLSFFIGAGPAVDNLKPSWVDGTFNKSYPVSGAPMADSGRLFAIGGDGDGWDCWGWGGELQIGWDLLTTVHWTDSDGAVPRASDSITGATFLTRFWNYDHMELVTKADVATVACDNLR